MAKVVKFPGANPVLVKLREEGLTAPVRRADRWDMTDVAMAVQALSDVHARSQIGDVEFGSEMVDVALIVLRIQSTSGAE